MEVLETRVEGPVPRFEVPGWREEYGVIAGITGRDDNAEFDLGLWSDRPVGQIMQRWNRLQRVEPGFEGMVLGHQVHSTRVGHRARVKGWLMIDDVDGHTTDVPGLMLAVTVADCIPIYLFDPVRRAIGLLHSGWRGTAAGILRIGLEVMEARYGTSVEDVVMHCGVGICGVCYEVGSEVMEAIGAPLPDSPPYHLDLRQLLAFHAESLGVGLVSTSQYCSSHIGWFYSHRRSRGAPGRMVAYLGIPGGN